MFRLLVIDGYDETRATLVDTLEAAGYDVVAAAEEDEGRAALEARAVDIVLLDLPAPELAEAAAALRATTHGATARLVALVDPAESRAMRERAVGIDYFFLRPCPPAEVVKHLRRMSR